MIYLLFLAFVAGASAVILATGGTSPLFIAASASVAACLGVLIVATRRWFR